jgi:hypothetical protein
VEEAFPKIALVQPVPSDEELRAFVLPDLDVLHHSFQL